MTKLTHWNPFKTFGPADPIANFDDMFRGLGLRTVLRDADAPLEMRMDVTEDDKAYTVVIEIPGVAKDDIDISIDGNQVSVSAEVKRESTKESGKELHTERFTGTSFRSFTLPQDVNAAEASAQYENGTVHLTLPKKPNGQAKRIAIQ